MGLIVPTVSITPGPTYAAEVNTSLTTVDSHNHTSGQGVAIPPSGLNINSDLTFGNNNATNVQTVRFYPLVSPLAGSTPNLGCLYEAGVDLYYNDGSGNQVRLTQGGSPAGTPGSISGLSAPATASYVSGSSKFVWQSDVNIAAIMDFRSAIFRTSAASSNGVTVSAPASIPSNYNLTLPTTGSATSFMSITSAGVIAPYVAIANGITRNNQAAVQQLVSPSSGAFQTTATSYTTIGSLTVSGATVGRPCIITLNSDQSGSPALFSVAANENLTIQLLEDTVEVGSFQMGATDATTYPGNVWQLSTPSPGNHTWAVKIKSTSGGAVNVNFVTLCVYEL